MESSIAIAKSLFKHNKFQEAINTCNIILSTDNNSIEAIKLIAKSLLATRKIEDARSYLNQALNIQPDDCELIKDLGNTYQAIGDDNTAKNYYQKAIAINSSYAPALTNLGSIELNKGNKDEALFLSIKATESDPQLAPAWGNLAKCYLQFGKEKEAEIACVKAIELNPNLFNSHFLMGSILLAQKKLKEAEQPLRKTIALNPDFFQAHLSLGAVLKELGQLEAAELSTRKSIELNPNLFDSHFLMGRILIEQNKLQEAEQALRQTIELKPDFYKAHSILGALLGELGNPEKAEISTRKAIELNPDFAYAHSNLGTILKDLGKLKEAEISTRKAIELNPDYADAHSNLGTILNELGNLKEAELSTRKAIELNPKSANACFNLSLIELLQGDYESGLRHYEFRIKTSKGSDILAKPNIRKFVERKLKKGEKLLVVSEQSPGDVIFHMRYLLPLKQQGIDLSFCAPEKLHSLIQDSGIHANPLPPEKCSLIKEGEWIPLLSLLKYFSISPKNPLINTPYISSTKELKDKWRRILFQEKRPIVAINWQGNPAMEKTYQGRSIPLEKFSKVLEKNDIRFLSLQKGFGSEQRTNCSFKEHFVRCQDQIDDIWDYSETAAIIENCDLIITNDCSIGPLAAGMGKKVWLLLRDIPFWYWGLNGESTFWYPSMRLFRQQERHNWDEVIEKISIAMQHELRTYTIKR